jgi:hypothetical protein
MIKKILIVLYNGGLELRRSNDGHSFYNTT